MEHDFAERDHRRDEREIRTATARHSLSVAELALLLARYDGRPGEWEEVDLSEEGAA